MYYFIGFVVVFFALFNLTKKYDLSLFLSLSGFAALTAFNYSIAAFATVSAILLLFWVKKVNIKMLNFAMITYIFASMTEFIAHKYVMHCKNSSFLTSIIQYIPFFNNVYNANCSSHLQHHLEVEPDMKLNGVKDKHSLFQGWHLSIPFSVAFTLFALLARYLSNYTISLKYLFIISCSIVIFWGYVWNKVHAKMHNYEGEYSIQEGPYENKLDTTFLKNMLFKNHEMHHLQKGDKKGNYNVIYLGADEWFGLNNKIPDNREYCKTHQSEKICKQ